MRPRSFARLGLLWVKRYRSGRSYLAYVAKGQELTSVDLFGQRLRHLEACSIKSCATELIVLPLKVRIPTGAGDAARLAQLAVFGNSLMKN